MSDDFLKSIDWDTFNINETTQEIIDRISEPTARFFMTLTKAEVDEVTTRYDIRAYTVASIDDLPKSAQLEARNYWIELEHPELNTTIKYPGAFARISDMPVRIRSRAPLVGEHNQDIYINELGISPQELVLLKQANVI